MAEGEPVSELEEHLRDVGSKLQSPPDDVDELFKLLEVAEDCLTRADQSPPASMSSAIRPAKEALIKKELLGHPNADVKLAVASCISEITRITAPEAPYEDDVMRDVFSIIVRAFENLNDTESPSFERTVSILDTVAKVRSCVVMLDLECDDLIVEMFHHFFKTVSSNHPENVISSMVGIMTLVIDESEEVHAPIAACLLQNAKNVVKETSSASFELAERVIGECAEKLKPVFLQLLQDTPLSEYSSIITSVCEDSSDAREDTNGVPSGKDTVDDDKLSKGTSSDELTQETTKVDQDVTQTAAKKKADQDISSDATPVDSGTPVSPKKKVEQPFCAENAKDVGQLKPVNDQGGESVVATNPKESSDVASDKNVELKPSCESEATANSNVDIDKEAGLKQSSPAVNGAVQDTSGPADSTPTAVKPKRGRPPGPKSLEKKAAAKKAAVNPELEKGAETSGKSTKRSSKNEPKPSTRNTGEGGSSKKHQSISLKKQKDEILSEQDTSETNDSEGKLTKRSSKNEPKPSTKNTGEGGSSKKQQSISLKKQKDEILSEEDTSKDMSLKEMISPKLLSKGSGRTKGLKNKENSGSKRNCSEEDEEAPRLRGKNLDGKDLVGSRIKVWWPDDQKFYNGVVESFNASSKKHTISYDDGDEEVLLLRDEKWEFIDEEQDGTPDVASDMPRGRKRRGSSVQLLMETPKSGGGDLPKKRGRPKGVRSSNGTPNNVSSATPGKKGKTASKDANGTPKIGSDLRKEGGKGSKYKDTQSIDKTSDLSENDSDKSAGKPKESGSRGKVSKVESKSSEGKARPGRKPKGVITTAAGEGAKTKLSSDKEKKERGGEAIEMEMEGSSGRASTGRKRRRKA